jgi:alpha-mannosidase
MIKHLYLVPHSHTDIGYTHPQPIVFELHRRFLEEAMDLADATAGRTDGTAFKWMIEVSGTALDWWRHASNTERDRFLAAAKAGRVEVGAMRWNQAHLSDHHMLIEAMEPVRILREAGVPIRSAMNTDVNGVNWGVVDVMLDHGIENFSMAINEHFGHAVRPRPQAFNWESPSGRKLLVHNGLIYGVSVSGWLGIPGDIKKSLTAVPRLVDVLEHVRYFNAQSKSVRVHIATLSEALDRLRQEDLSSIPTLRGDWPDWWTFGSGGTMRETAVTLAGERALRDAQQLAAWSPKRPVRAAVLESRAAEALALYVEHTYTADRAAKRPDSPDVDNQIHWKKAQAYEGLSLARMLRRDGLAAIASQHAGETRSALLYNPLPYPVRRALRVPKAVVTEQLFDPASHVLQRQDVEFSDYPDEEANWVGVALPALGYAVMPLADLKPFEGKVQASDFGLDNGLLRVSFDPLTGAVRSLVQDGIERVDGSAGFGVPVFERPNPQHRTSLYGPPVFNDIEKSLDMHAAWHPDWQAVRESGRLIETRVRPSNGHGQVIQVFAFDSGETVEVKYGLAAGEAALSIEVVVHKQRIADPHAFYLPMWFAEDGAWAAHYETAGAMVEWDKEQLPGSNRHFVPTQRFMRLQGATLGMSIATPDLPLFQVGGFTFGRHQRGAVEHGRPALMAWLNNNYWDTNFEVTQSGPLVTRFTLVPHPAEALGQSVQRILPYVAEPQLHVLNAAGATKGQLLEIEAGGLVLTGVERDGDRVQLFVLNADATAHTVILGPGALTLVSAQRTSLARRGLGALAVADGRLSLEVAPRAWVGIALEVAAAE